MADLDVTFLQNATRDHFIPGLRNQLYDRMPLWNRLTAAGRIRPAVGESLSLRITSKRHTAKGLFQGFDVLATQQINPIVKATADYANYYATVAISYEEVRRNSGNKEKLLDMIRVQMDNSLATLKEDETKDVYDDGTAIGGRNRILGLKAAVTGTTGTYLGINRATAGNEYWRANASATAHTVANLKDPTSTSYLPSLMRTSDTDATHDQSPDLIVTTKKIYNLYQDIAEVGNLRFNNEVANLGFGGVEFGPGKTMIFDDYATANYLYFLTIARFDLFVFGDANFDVGEWVKPANQEAKVAHIIWSGQLICNVPREQAVLSSVGAT